MPDNYKFFGEKFITMNPDWNIIDWDEDMILDSGVINKDVWDHLETPSDGQEVHPIALATQRADVVGYELIYKFGGLYLNTDIEPVRPLSILFNNHPELNVKPGAGFEIDQWVVNAIMWSPEKNNDFWKKVIDALPRRYFSMPDDYMSNTTGPHLLTQVWKENPGDLHVFEKDVFNPIYFPEVDYGSDARFNFDELPEITVGVHHWGHRKNMRPQTSKIPSV